MEIDKGKGIAAQGVLQEQSISQFWLAFQRCDQESQKLRGVSSGAETSEKHDEKTKKVHEDFLLEAPLVTGSARRGKENEKNLLGPRQSIIRTDTNHGRSQVLELEGVKAKEIVGDPRDLRLDQTEGSDDGNELSIGKSNRPARSTNSWTRQKRNVNGQSWVNVDKQEEECEHNVERVLKRKLSKDDEVTSKLPKTDVGSMGKERFGNQMEQKKQFGYNVDWTVLLAMRHGFTYFLELKLSI
ncbi:unnamed protein product [Arabis nemorensis]|uniref:Uncharacterized protein n=1 Tax=Arabis nemorensis TaxID=586526 RepID=A0A565C6H7_9BRAS|nr:unnamed protein product [Arabis nemorensis]